MSGWARLSRSQKWDPVRIAGAATLSTAFLGITLIWSQHQPTALASAVAPPLPTPETRVLVVARDVAVSVDAPKLSPVRVRLARSSARAAARPTLLRAKNNTSLRGRFVRLFAGDGRYVVRPFPTIED